MIKKKNEFIKLKLNFEGGYVRVLGCGGIGVVVQDHLGTVIHTLSGLTNFTNANKAEILSLLIRCKEFKVLNGFKAIIEGDSSLAIKWGSKFSVVSVEVS